MKKNSNLKKVRELGAKELADNLKDILKYLNINQDEFSKLTGLRQGQVSEILRGVRPNLTWAVLYRIAKTLNTSMESLIEGTYDLKKIRKYLSKDLE